MLDNILSKSHWATSSIFHPKNSFSIPKLIIYCAVANLQVQRGTGNVWHYYKLLKTNMETLHNVNQHGNTTHCVWKPTWKHYTLHNENQHGTENQHGNTTQCVFSKRKLVTSISTIPAWRPWLPFRFRPVATMNNVSCHHHLIFVKASSTVCLPFLVRNLLIGK